MVKLDPQITRKDRKQMFAIMSFELSRYGLVNILWPGRHIVAVVASIDLSLKIFAIDIMTALKSSLKHRRKHFLRSFRLYGDHRRKHVRRYE